MEKSLEEKINEEIRNAKHNWNNRLESSFKLIKSEERQIIETRDERFSMRDKNGIPIRGTGRVITNEEKQQVIDYIKENGYPLTARMYNIVLEEYLKDENLFNQSKGRKL